MTKSHLDEEARKKFKEDFEKNESPYWQRSFAIRKESTLEFIKLLDFLYLKIGSYTIDKDKNLQFFYEFDTQIYQNYVKKIHNLLDENDEIGLRIQKKREYLFGE